VRGRSLIAVAAVVAGLTSVPPVGADPNLCVGASGNLLRWDPDAAAALTRSLGIGVYRISLLWSPGSTQVVGDDAIQLQQAIAAAAGGRIIVSVYSAYGRDAPKTPASRNQYCAYLADLITRFPQINDIEIWIEPNKRQFWAPQFGPDESATAPAEYEALLARCWDVLHAVRATVNLIAPGTSPRGNDQPHARSNISESPGNFIRRMGAAYRASARRLPIFDSVGHNAYGDTSAERPWRVHRFSRTIAEGDWAKLLQALWDGFHGTGQPTPGRCVADKCVPLWYLEIGYQTIPGPDKASLYYGSETDPHPVPAYAGGDSEAHPAATSLAPDQATQIVDGIQLAFCQPYVEAYFIFNLELWDDADLALWQSAVFWADRRPKPSLPFVQRVIAQVNADGVDCADLKAWPPPTQFHPLDGVDVAIVGFTRRGRSLRARVRLAEDATYTLTLKRATGAPLARHTGQLPLGWIRMLRFSVPRRHAASYRLVLRLVATANPARRSTLVSRVFRVG
jgi:hypothetical protein